MQWLKAGIEQVVNRSNNTLKMVNNDKKDNDKLKYHKTIIDILKEEKGDFHTYQPRQRHMQRGNQKSIPLGVSRNSWENELKEYNITLAISETSDTDLLITPYLSS
jgi:hypothetical protein